MASFEAFARKAGVEGPFRREMLWKDQYRNANLEVFTGAENAVPAFASGVATMVRELSRVRVRAKEGAPEIRSAIEELDATVGGVLGAAAEPAPLHVVMVGTFTANTAVGEIGDDIAVFHFVEWYQSVDGARALVAHETAHAWHRLALRQAGQSMPPDDDLLWLLFTEGLATQVSRAAAPGLSEVDYFWYGHPGMDDWVQWCAERAGELRSRLGDAVDDPAAADTFFGGGLVDERWRVGYHVADRLVASLNMTLPDLAALSVADARDAVSHALHTD
jgi:hypothetical protein